MDNHELLDDLPGGPLTEPALIALHEYAETTSTAGDRPVEVRQIVLTDDDYSPTAVELAITVSTP